MRIVYIIDSLAHKGGAERIISEKMNYLATQYGYDISVITCYQFPDTMPNSYFLSDKVRQINLCFSSHQKYKYSYPRRFWYNWKYAHQFRMELEKAVNSIKPDIVIGLGYTFADVVCRINCKARKIIEAHEARQFTKASYLIRDLSPFTNVYYRLIRQRYLHAIEKKADVVVTLTKDDALNWRKAKRVETIPNFSAMSISGFSDCKNKRIISVGRLEWQKGYDRLLSIWAIVTKKHPDWQLDIYGEGTLEKELSSAIQEFGFNNVAIHPYTHHISQEYAKSSICVLTSRYEGFSLVLLEAMRHGVPCVTFDCPYGPKDLVDQGKCGFVIENGNINQFAEKLCYLIDNPELKKQYAVAAINKGRTYQVDTIMNQWKLLFESLVSNN